MSDISTLKKKTATVDDRIEDLADAGERTPHSILYDRPAPGGTEYVSQPVRSAASRLDASHDSRE